MGSRNEWDKLERVIVGIANDAAIPPIDLSLRVVNYADKDNSFVIPHGLYPQAVIDEANEDLEKFCDFLRSQHVIVERPDRYYKPKYYNYCPRDTVIVVDDTLVATPTPLMSREYEYLAMKGSFDYRKLIVAPQPDRYKLYNTDCIGNKDILALNEIDPCFDAANVLRANDDLYYLVSNSGNKKGAEYLQSLFPNLKVHTIENVYSYMHLDSTIAFLREGLMLLNPARIKSKDVLPEPLRSWDAIFAPDPVDIGHYPGYCNASPWVSVNLFSVNPELAVVEEHQVELARMLEKHGIDVKLLPMRHARTLGGCFHCVTLDLDRKTV